MDGKEQEYNRRINQITRRIKHELESDLKDTIFVSRSTSLKSMEADIENIGRIRLCNGYPVN